MSKYSNTLTKMANKSFSVPVIILYTNRNIVFYTQLTTKTANLTEISQSFRATFLSKRSLHCFFCDI